MTAEALLEDVERIRTRTRQDRHATSVPLLTFAALGVGDALVRALTESSTGASSVYWAIAAPAGFAITAWLLRRHEIETGVGTRSSSYRPWAIGLLAALLLFPLFMLFGAPLALIGLGLLTIAVRQGNAYLGVSAVLFAIVGVLDGFFFIVNRIYEVNHWLGAYDTTSGYATWASPASALLPSFVLLAAGLVARRRERNTR